MDIEIVSILGAAIYGLVEILKRILKGKQDANEKADAAVFKTQVLSQLKHLHHAAELEHKYSQGTVIALKEIVHTLKEIRKDTDKTEDKVDRIIENMWRH